MINTLIRFLNIFVLECTVVIASLSCQSTSEMPATFSVPQQSRSITLHLPEPWIDSTDSRLELSFVQQIEVRKAPGSPEDEFLFAALPYGDNDYTHELYKDIPKPTYSLNSFVVNLSGSPTARAATAQEWESASRIQTKTRMAFYNGRDDSSGEIELRGKRFHKVGKYWGGGCLSPRGRWLATFSYTGVKPPPDLLFGGGSPRSGDALWEVYDTVTGDRVFEWKAIGVASPTSLNSPVLWLDERYFLFPQDDKAQDFIVVALPKFFPEKNPVTGQLPSRKDKKGERIPAPSRHEAWAPLIALPPERAAEISKPQPPELTEVRLSADQSHREFLIAILEVTENRTVHREARDGAGEYNYRVFSTYYYAVSLNDPTQTRSASKEEWERARDVSRRSQVSLGETIETTGGKRPAYRPFPKTGATWGQPQALTSGGWIAVFSYTEETGARAAGKMFVDIYETRSGNQFSMTELPYTGSANDLFNAAVWIESGYLIVPLNSSLDSLALWSLPGGM